jgi:RNA polymerase sigma factor for flagellar operon FliA
MTSSMPPSRDEVDSPEVAARVQSALVLVRIVVHQMKSELALHARIDDLTSYGNEGALVAARTYDVDQGVSFDRWATLKIRGAIIDGLRVQTDLPRRLYERLRALDAVNWTQEGIVLDDAGSPPPGSAQAADQRIEDRLAAMATAYAARVFMANDQETLEALRDSRGTPEEELAREQLRAAVRSAIAERPDDERTLLERYYYGGATMAEASGGLSRSWSSRLHARAIAGVARSLMRAKIPR